MAGSEHRAGRGCGELEWAARVGRGWGDSGASSIGSPDPGHFLLTGSFADRADFVLADGSEVALEAAGPRDGFLLELCPERP